MVLNGIGGRVAPHEAAHYGAIEDFVGVDDGGQHLPHRIAVEDPFFDASRALM